MKKIFSMILLELVTLALPASALMPQERQDTLKIKAATQNPHGIISIACDACHATGDWKIPKKELAFDHNTETGFPLEGQHRSGDCKACHANYQFAGSKTECYECHNDIHKGQLGKQCDQCHTSKSWQPFNFKVQHDLTRFPLTGKHATTDCQSCHKDQQNEFKGLTTLCSGCHMAEYNSSNNPNHAQYQIPLTCEACHTPQGWSPARIIDHTQFGFELTRGHSNIACATCHSNGNYAVTGDCYSCHKNDYDQSNDPQHLSGNYSTNCLQCHTTSPGWTPATFDHAVSAFPLTGAHIAEQEKCISCHTGGFMNTPKLCNSCHAADFDQANNPDHVSGNYSRNCEECHSTNPGWKPAMFDHNASSFSLTGGHLAVQDQCQKCHSAGYNNTPIACYDCHQQEFLNTTAPEHVSGNFSTHCEQCHTTNPGWKPATFDHGTTSFTLTGAHLSVQDQCLACHASGFANTPTDCYACHQQDFANTTNPNHQAGNYSTNCVVCHTTNPGWQPVVYNHNLTNFPLTGAHSAIQNQCTSCHINGYVNTPTACYSCHQSAYNSSTNPNHPALVFPTNCEQCHTTNAGWRPSTFDHNTTQFPLTGAHITVAAQCVQCHTTSLAGTGTACYSCHQAAYNGSTNPNHPALVFPTNCEQCHTTNAGWRPSTFDHNTTQFPLTGAHVTVAAQCVQCHTTSLAGTGTACYSCHQTEYSTAASPNHAASAFPTNCEQCHTTNLGWTPSTFDHNTTQFQLTGSHLTVANQCNTCHTSSLAGTSTVCYSCHQTAYNGSANPNHSALAFPTNCEQCHTTNAGWRPSTFDHNTTQFQLTGAHLTVTQCSQCHTTSLSGTSTACYSCHQTVFTSTTDPNHVTNNFPTDCSLCHTTNLGWTPASFDHNTTTFPLTGAHLSVASQCISCHAGGYVNTPTNCYACHQTDYNNAANPNHASNNFPTNCTQCHSTVAGWTPSTFDHNATQFPLTGAHLTVASQCITCHAGGYVSTPTNCYACHQTDYNQAASPNHSALSFPTTCETGCHSTTGWTPSTFNHGTYTTYSLIGAHQAIAAQCDKCHTGNLTSANTACYACHQNDYNSTTKPNHTGSGFSQDCQNCHNQNIWIPWTVNHDAQYFPINSGKHGGIWTGCGGGSGDGAGCHTNDSDWRLYSCIHCHEHNITNTNDHHNEVKDYVYTSQACLTCHPHGIAGAGKIKKFVR